MYLGAQLTNLALHDPPAASMCTDKPGNGPVTFHKCQLGDPWRLVAAAPCLHAAFFVPAHSPLSVPCRSTGTSASVAITKREVTPTSWLSSVKVTCSSAKGKVIGFLLRAVTSS